MAVYVYCYCISLLQAGFSASIYIYIYIYIYEHEAIQKTISENNIGAPKKERKKKQVFRVRKLMGRQWGTPNSNYLLAMGWLLLLCHLASL